MGQQGEDRCEEDPQTKDVLATEPSGKNASRYLSEDVAIEERRQYPSCVGEWGGGRDEEI